MHHFPSFFRSLPSFSRSFPSFSRSFPSLPRSFPSLNDRESFWPTRNIATHNLVSLCRPVMFLNSRGSSGRVLTRVATFSEFFFFSFSSLLFFFNSFLIRSFSVYYFSFRIRSFPSPLDSRCSRIHSAESPTSRFTFSSKSQFPHAPPPCPGAEGKARGEVEDGEREGRRGREGQGERAREEGEGKGMARVEGVGEGRGRDRG